uniref:AAA+ ATPase domain-containing protein n=1 Tax=Spongospora subterranea TaxID=70186 RepID=A0A0H5RQP0_9EUKA|eukprot:CRZ11034.1 hypothetical protein [Spongospora subterranea]
MVRVTRLSKATALKPNCFESLVQRKPRNANLKKPKCPAKEEPLLGTHIQAIERLRTVAPKDIPCRQSEIQVITEFVAKCIKSCQGSSLYITGSPGTGKTISVDFAIQGFTCKKSVINAMSLPSAVSFYRRLYMDVFKVNSPTNVQTAISRLGKHFTAPGAMNLVIIDEIDHLTTTSQDVLYQIFQWAHAERSRLTLIGIANSAELTDHNLPRLSKHNIFPERLVFMPYAYQDLLQILTTRLSKGLEIFHPFAAELLARKIASASAGDARKFLDLCRKSIMSAEETGTKTVVISTVASVIKSALDSQSVDRIQALPSHQQIVLSMLVLMLDGKIAATSVGEFRAWYLREAKRQRLPVVEASDFTSVIQSLAVAGLVNLKPKKNFQGGRINSLVQKQDVEFALKDVHFFATLLKSKLV